jgi:hypothetical protein
MSESISTARFAASASSCTTSSVAVYTTQQQQQHLREFVNEKQKTDIGLCFHHELEVYVKFNTAEMREQMIIWKKQRKNGDLIINPKNNQSRMLFGKQVYLLVIQTPDLKNIPMIDPLGLGFDDGHFLISGYIYLFTKEINRDAIYKYVMGL